MIGTLAAALALSSLPSISMIAPASPLGAWRLYEGNYWQTCQGKSMNQPRCEIVTGGASPKDPSLESASRMRRVEPIVNPAPIIGKELSWAKFYGVDGLRILNSTIRFTRDNENQGCGLNFRFSKNIRLEYVTIILESDLPVTVGASGYGVVFSGCENVTLVNLRVVSCHAGAMFTDGTSNFQVFDSVGIDTWNVFDAHGGATRNGLACRVRSEGAYGRMSIGNVTLPDGATNMSVIDCTLSALEFSGKVRNAKVQGGSFQDVIFNQYLARPGDSQNDYSQSGIEVDGSTKVGKFLVKSL